LDKTIIFDTFTNVNTTVNIPIKKLKKMKSPLDLFSSQILYDETLIEKGIYPPLPIYGDVIVWGYKIIRQAEKKDIRELSCIEIYDKHPLEHLKIALKLENRWGNYSWTEKVKILEYLKEYDLLQEAFHISKYIEENGDSSWIKKAQIYKSLPKNLKSMIEREHIDFKTASLVKELDDDIFLSLENSGHFSFTEKRLLLTYFFEVVKRDNLNSPKSIDLFKNLLASPGPLVKLKELRFPELSHMEKRYNTLYEKYVAKEGFRMTHPPYFEGDSFSITFSFNSLESLDKKIKKIQYLQDHIDEFFSLLR